MVPLDLPACTHPAESCSRSSARRRRLTCAATRPRAPTPNNSEVILHVSPAPPSRRARRTGSLKRNPAGSAKSPTGPRLACPFSDSLVGRPLLCLVNSPFPAHFGRWSSSPSACCYRLSLMTGKVNLGGSSFTPLCNFGCIQLPSAEKKSS